MRGWPPRFNGLALSWVRDIEVVRRFVGDSSLFSRLFLATTLGRSFAADSAHALHALRLAEDATARSRFRFQQQPGNGVGVRTIIARLDLSQYFAFVIRFPGRTCIVLADLPSDTVEEICLRSLEDPFEPGGIGPVGFALINLYTSGLRLK